MISRSSDNTLHQALKNNQYNYRDDMRAAKWAEIIVTHYNDGRKTSETCYDGRGLSVYTK